MTNFKNQWLKSAESIICLFAMLFTFACSEGTPTSGPNGLTYTCQGNVNDTATFPATIIAEFGKDTLPGVPRIDKEFTFCEAADLTQIQRDYVLGGCQTECETYYIKMNPNDRQRYKCDQLDVVPDATKPCEHGSPRFLGGGPSDSEVILDRNVSTALLSINGKSVQVPISGFVDTTIEAGCNGPTCPLRITDIVLTPDNFTIDGHPVSNVIVRNEGFLVGTWQDNNMFSIPAQSSIVQATFKLDGNQLLTRLSGPIQGTINRDYSNFSINGTFTNGTSSVQVHLGGSTIAHPPTAVLTPTGPFQCDSPGAAHVVFSSAQSSDPDNDIQARFWSVDTNRPGANAVTFPTTLSLGSHTVSVLVEDSRAATSFVSQTVQVIDTNPPQLNAIVTPNCLFPPNHKYALFTLGNGINPGVSDTCDPTPQIRIVSVTSNQPALGGGSGNTAPDYVFGSGAVCVRSERDGTRNSDRVYTVTLEATDSAGNKTTQQVAITVPHDQGGMPKCDNQAAFIVEDNDPRCLMSAPQPQTNTQATAATPMPTTGAASGGYSGCSVSLTSRPQDPPWMLLIPSMLALYLCRRRWKQTLTSVLLLAAGNTMACSSSDSIGNSPVSGSVQSMPFSVVGSSAKWSASRDSLGALLTSYSSTCGSPTPSPQSGQTFLEVGFSIPSAKATPGSYPIMSSPILGSPDISVGVTQRSSAPLNQTTTYIQGGSLRIDSITADKLSGGLDLTQNDIRLSGTFSIPICP